MRVPGFMSRIFGRSFRLIEGSRNIVIHARLREVGLEEIGLHERRLVGDARRLGVALGQRHHVGVILDPHRAGAALGGRDDGTAVARAQVDHEVLGCDLGHVEHLVDQRLRRRHPDDVLAGLTDLRLERLLPRLRPGWRHQRVTTSAGTMVRTVRRADSSMISPGNSRPTRSWRRLTVGRRAAQRPIIDQGDRARATQYAGDGMNACGAAEKSLFVLVGNGSFGPFGQTGHVSKRYRRGRTTAARSTPRATPPRRTPRRRRSTCSSRRDLLAARGWRGAAGTSLEGSDPRPDLELDAAVADVDDAGWKVVDVGSEAGHGLAAPASGHGKGRRRGPSFSRIIVSSRSGSNGLTRYSAPPRRLRLPAPDRRSR